MLLAPFRAFIPAVLHNGFLYGLLHAEILERRAVIDSHPKRTRKPQSGLHYICFCVSSLHRWNPLESEWYQSGTTPVKGLFHSSRPPQIGVQACTRKQKFAALWPTERPAASAPMSPGSSDVGTVRACSSSLFFSFSCVANPPKNKKNAFRKRNRNALD